MSGRDEGTVQPGAAGAKAARIVRRSGSGSLATLLVAGASIALGALTAAVLVQRLRTPVAAT